MHTTQSPAIRKGGLPETSGGTRVVIAGSPGVTMADVVRAIGPLRGEGFSTVTFGVAR
jgi:hypothetical protein